jgi:hypothetical protein
MRKKVFFRLFRIDAKYRNLKRKENETKRKRNEKEAKLPSFSLRSEMKRIGSEIFSLRCEKSVWKLNEAKNEKEAKTSTRKRILGQSAKKRRKILRSVFQFFKSLPSEVKKSEKYVYFVSLWSETNWKNVFSFRLEAKRKIFGSETKRKYGVRISLWFEAKRSEVKRNNFLFTWACEKKFFGVTGAPYAFVCCLLRDI